MATISPAQPGIRLRDYLELVEWTARQLRDGTCGTVSEEAPLIVRRIEKSTGRWPVRVKAVGSRYWRVVGDAQDLIATAGDLGQRWLRGIGFARWLEKIR
ncbi:MAG: hypothetical protein JNN30_09585 [Rhodanobacteraceae bacterium]|nr:hypothetical protein [Rhodanobacteraceae bacterium]